MSGSPDFIEPFKAWKGLRADSEGRLFSPMTTTPWPEGEALVATCERKRHTPPVTSCGCGIYAVKTFEDLHDAGYNWSYWSISDDEKVWVIAKVKLWGRIRPGRIGYRAQFAYPEKVYVPGSKLPLGVLIKRRYGVSVGIIDRFSGRRT